MAGNSDDQNLDNPANTQTENSSDEIISTKDTVTITPNQDTKNMEVHKHPHHLTHKKKWGEYVLEFFMIFFAITMGFFAENIREHFADVRIEKEYLSTYKQQLQINK